MGFRVAWYSYYTQAQKSAINYQVGPSIRSASHRSSHHLAPTCPIASPQLFLLCCQILYHVQHQHACCGFGPPLDCQVDTRPLPSQFPTYALFSSFKRQRQSCGVEVGGHAGAL